jgi:hypothetical protein
MNRTATHKLTRLAAALAPAAAIAAFCGHPGWSDENLKQQIESINGATGRLRSL